MAPRLTRLLIANRGEIALRIIRACRELHIETVAVYSDADLRAPHVHAADRTVRLGPAPASESYLSIPKLMDAAAASGADAIHPGYGFLAENSAFAAACEDRHLIFVGPPASVIERMGSKVEARATMKAAGVPIVPGETPADQSREAIAAAARRVGFPLMIKASAGGGGKGMRTVAHAHELDEAVAAARREATGAFGDGTVYLERLLTDPRHVEIQIMADGRGEVVHLFERDCSLQRRHQKVIEESPSPTLSPLMRERMAAAAVTAARAVGYRNAGTVEFLLTGEDHDASFYFLEMNTRLQVEHPVTEAITGVDLVHAQLEVAARASLPWTQEQLTRRGHAIECRVYAEDPAHDFLPQAGRLRLYREPRHPGVRIDSGVVEGAEVSVHYDPLIAKLIAFAETRDHAIERARASLAEFPIFGVTTNIAFLRRVLDDERFRKGAVHTGFLDREGSALAHPEAGSAPPASLAAAVMHVFAESAPKGSEGAGVSDTAAHDPWTELRGWRN